MATPRELPTPLLILQPCPEPGTILLVISGPITRADIPKLCERVRELLQGQEGELVVCDVRAIRDPDAVTVDALARLQLTARQLGRRVWLQEPCIQLVELLALMGLTDAVPVAPGSLPQSRGQAEQREPARGVEEEADPGDPIV